MDITYLLYIDDDPDDYEFFAEAIADLLPGTRVMWLTHCNDLPEFLRTNEIDIIFLDFHLPKLSGKECMSLIRSHEDHYNTPIVFYSTISVQEQNKMPKDNNVYFISKPYTYEQLKEQLAVFFREHAMLGT